MNALRSVLVWGWISLATFGQDPGTTPALFDVSVSRSDGAPAAEMPVALFARRHGQLTHVWVRIWSGKTDAKGHLAVRLPHWHIGQGRAIPPGFIRWSPQYATEDVRVALDLPLRAPREVTVHLEIPPREPVRLVAPPTAPLLVRATSSDGTLLPVGVNVELACDNLPEPISAMAVHGVARFPHVELGVPFRLQTRSNHWAPGPALPCEGLTASGRSLTVKTGPAYPVVTGWLTQSTPSVGGLPMPLPVTRKALQIAIRIGDEKFQTHAFAGDDGRFQFTLNHTFQNRGPAVLEVWPEKPVYGLQLWNPPALKARTTIELPLQPGPVTLPTLTLQGAPVLLRGTVVDARTERTIDGCDIRIRLHRKGAPYPMRFEVVSGPKGRFVLHGDPFDGHLEVEAHAPGHGKFAAVDVLPGTRDLRVPIGR